MSRQNIDNFLLREDDDLARQNEKLTRMIASLMQRVEASNAQSPNAFAHFQTAATLEAQVRQRTLALEEALDALNQSRARAESLREEADQARRDLADAIEAIREGFALFDPSNRLVLANKRFARMFPDIVEAIKPGLDFQHYAELVANSGALVFGEGISRQSWLEERMRVHKTPNQQFLVEVEGDRWFQINDQLTANHSTTVMQTEVTDMVRLERMERQRLLDEQMALVRATLEHIDQGVLIIDKNRLLAGSNSKIRDHLQLPISFFQTGHRVALMIDEIAEKGIFRSTRDLFLLIDWMRNSNRAQTFRGEFIRQDGALFAVFAQTMPDDGFVVSVSDVTRERQAARALQDVKESLERRVHERTEELSIARDQALQANQAKTRLLAATSHDLLQPINAAKLFLQTLSSSGLDAKQAAIATNISQAFSSVETMLRGLVDLSRLDTPTPIEPSAVSLQQIFDVLEVEFLPMAEAKNLSLRFVPTQAHVQSHRETLRRITQNLIANAIKFTHQGGVLIGTRQRGARIWLEIYDTGAGLSEGELMVMYNEFQRFDREGDSGAGMGLGLSIVQRSSVLLGHELFVKSQVGRGSRFRVEMDAASEMVAQTTQGETSSAANIAPDLANLMVLVIDNDEAILGAMELLLESWGATAILAKSGGDAMALLEEIDMGADIALVDFQLENGRDGLEVIADLQRFYPDMDAILITANRADATLARAKTMGVKVNHKPVDLDALKAHLSQLRVN